MVAVNHPDNDEGERLMRIAVQQAQELWGPSAMRTRQYEDALVWRQIRSGSASKQKEAEAYCRELFEVSFVSSHSRAEPCVKPRGLICHPCVESEERARARQCLDSWSPISFGEDYACFVSHGRGIQLT
jgi:hypothetical protein